MDKQRKKQIKKYIAFGISVLLVILLAVLPLIASKNAEPDGPQASILTATAENRTIKNQLIGGGQLASNATKDVTIPTEIKLKEYLVGNGDIVKKGAPIATVDKVSVLSALAEVQETLDYFSSQLASAASRSDADTVTAHAGGLVKVIYAKAGDSVRDVMLRDGALAVLSLDGRMAVTIERNTDLKAGSTVCVYLADDTEVEGKVESSVGGKLVVSIEDKDYDIGEKVTVKTEDGDRLGSGTLYVHNAWHATAYYGSIGKVKAKEGDTLAAGKTLFELKVEDYSTQFQILKAEREEYEELMLELFKMYDSGVITAPCDGIITGVDDDATFLLSAVSVGQTWQVQLLSNFTPNEQPSYSVILLSNADPIPPSSEGTDPDSPPGGGSDECGSGSDAPPAGDTPENVECTGQPDCQAATHKENCPKFESVLYKVKEVKEDRVILQKINSSELVEYMSTTYPDGSPITVGQQVSLSGGIIKNEGGTQGQMPGDMSVMPGGMGGMGGFGGMGGMGGMGGASSAFTPYSLDELTIASVTSQEEMTLEITVDEHDIATLTVGQQANVTVEALTGQNFPATVTSISNTGTNEGGSSKFTAKLTLDKSGDMLPGMHASAYLTLGSAENVLTVPVAALVEEGTKTLVYTGYNEKDEKLTNPVEVTTGVSDGEYVQILSGLNPGDTVRYAYYDTLEVSNAPDSGFSFR